MATWRTACVLSGEEFSSQRKNVRRADMVLASDRLVAPLRRRGGHEAPERLDLEPRQIAQGTAHGRARF